MFVILSLSKNDLMRIIFLKNCIATMILLLRRTLVRSVILIIIVEVYNYYGTVLKSKS